MGMFGEMATELITVAVVIFVIFWVASKFTHKSMSDLWHSLVDWFSEGGEK